MLFVCPKCKRKLNISKDGRAVCEAGHSYDRARGGYYNLLLSHGGIHGDNKEMVAARREFLGEGYYRPLAEAISDILCKNTEKNPVVLDAGCGEAYYTDIFERALRLRDGESRVYAYDISKDAVRCAVKKNKNIGFAVAGSYHMPVPDASVCALVNIFSPLALPETHRVLSEGGIFVMAIPDEEHLFELKAAIYDTPYKNAVEDTALEGFRLVSDTPLSYKMELDSQEKIRSLFMMTPYAYRTSRANAERVFALSSLSVTAAFRILVYRK